MDSYLKSLLEAEHSKRQKDLIAQEIVAGKINLDELIEIIKTDTGIYAQRGAFVLTSLHDNYPETLSEYRSTLHKLVTPEKHQAIGRCVYRYYTDIDIPEEIEGELFDDCLKALISKNTPIAVKAHAMTIVSKSAVKYPELKKEVIFAITEQLPGSSKGYQSRAKKELKQLRK